jgi:GNAT superfamily N-acetyltransferase
VTVGASEADRRSRVVRLTPAGQAERRLLDRLSDDAASALLEPLSPAKQRELVAAMGTVERLVTAGAVQIAQADPDDPDARACIDAYFAELNRRSETPFDPAAGVTADPHELRPPAGIFLLAYLHGEPVGCGAVKNHPGELSEIKRMWVADRARGMGLGRRMLEALERQAAEFGATTVRLDTNRNLTEAIAMYRSAGYTDIERYNDEPFAHHWFQKRLSG